MLINHVTSNIVDGCGRVLRRTTLYGQRGNIHYAMDSYKFKGTTIMKRYVAWGDTWQRIVNKQRNIEGKFERIG